MTLENLVRIKALNNEPPDKREFEGLVRAAADRLNDAENEGLSYASRFDLAYNAAHGRIRIFAICHDRRNRAEYEGQLESDEPLLDELIATTKVLLNAVRRLSV